MNYSPPSSPLFLLPPSTTDDELQSAIFTIVDPAESTLTTGAFDRLIPAAGSRPFSHQSCLIPRETKTLSFILKIQGRIYEALELRDGGSDYLGKGVSKAVENVKSIIGPAHIGKNPTEHTKIDNLMVQELDGTVNELGWCKQKLGEMLY
ncbi:hypothetical protein L2E82_49188 [Cichorium intybus]|uniref:Uncharacterized protein n=1 Tax=Cichorium intybus TaxID=13427 RepID=A0ACB8Z130_CICIN|nr:hypothetical protein L2E82_49188 [Cichorium intybus]